MTFGESTLREIQIGTPPISFLLGILNPLPSLVRRPRRRRCQIFSSIG
jgi:hypothetical protein